MEGRRRPSSHSKENRSSLSSLRPRDSPSHRGEPEEARLGARRLRPRRAQSPRPRRPRAARGHARSVRRAPAQREPHPEARAHGPDALLGDRQRVLGRDPARREALSRRAHVAPDGRRGRRASSTRRGRPSSSGPTACGATPERRSRKRSRRSARTWPCTGSSASHVPGAGPPSSASSTPRTRRTTARRARRAAGSSRTVPSRVSSTATGRRASRRWRSGRNGPGV